MIVEEIDFAIYGSDVDAAFLAAELVRKHDAKVLLIRDQVNDYSLHHLQTYSVGAFCEPKTLNMIEEGAECWHNQFSGRIGRDCFERVDLSLNVGDQGKQDLLHYVEGAMIAIDRQCERRVDPNNHEYLHFRDVISPNRKKTLEFVHGKYVGSGLSVFDRTHFEEAKRQRGGPLALRSAKVRYNVQHAVFLDADLVQSQTNSRNNNALQPYLGTKIVVGSTSARAAHWINVDGEFEARPHSIGKVLVKSSGTFTNLAGRAIGIVDGFQACPLLSQGTYADLATTDGAPLFANLNVHYSVFVGGKNPSAFLMPSIAALLTNDRDIAANPYWGARSSKNRQCADILQVAELGGN